MANHFGPNVIGHEAHEKALREEKGGANVFGTRVRDQIPDSGPTNIAKRVSSFGPAVTAFAHGSDTKGEPNESLEIDDLRNVLTENPTFLDSLFEAELGRSDGARPDALAIFYEFERGIKGAMREDVMADIRALLGQKGIDADARANLARAQVTAIEEQQARNEENVKLGDAPRIKALREREENLKFIEENGSESGKAQVISSDQNRQVQDIADRDGLDLGQQSSGGVVGRVPAKPNGDVHPETQQPGPRPLAPKGTGQGEGTDNPNATSNGQGGSSPADGAGSEEEEDDLTTYTKADLEDYLGDEVENVKGTGSEGAVLKDDLLKAAKRKQRRFAKGE
jgi:hypothetical protein